MPNESIDIHQITKDEFRIRVKLIHGYEICDMFRTQTQNVFTLRRDGKDKTIFFMDDLLKEFFGDSRK